MSVETRAYDKPNDDGFPPDPVVVLVATGTTDVSRLVHALARGNSEQIRLAEQISRQLRRHNAGRAALSLLKAHGGADFAEEPKPPQRQWAVRHPEVTLCVHRSRHSALFTLAQVPGGVLVTRMSDEGDDAWVPESGNPYASLDENAAIPPRYVDVHLHATTEEPARG
ncbi:hypothetical protein [Lentzea cavernae]|uniref:Uncharacterized protein n=1 Tax=Lentzea cavernae TaxID=2020703 RepID=A0ABQ3MTT7_9PSEU|nr:hypothetical protein [Lentzea cavernae]GHH57539.1 hypothetical protein GCM10017774_77200 [Lentzea cavernae]